jgi:hypothetical protein
MTRERYVCLNWLRSANLLRIEATQHQKPPPGALSDRRAALRRLRASRS